MLLITNLTVNHTETGKEILHDISLQFELGTTYILEGPNGSGKSTLVNTIMGNPDYTVSKGFIALSNPQKEKLNFQNKSMLEIDDLGQVDITNFHPTDRSRLGLFLAHQYPIEIPGVSLLNYLYLLHSTHHPENKMPIFAFKKMLFSKADLINYPHMLLERNLNEGFSGGEKKKTEILQMLVTEPTYVFLDEIDSGLDKQSTQEIFSFLHSYFKNKSDATLVVISHYEQIYSYLSPQKIIRFKEGSVV